MIVSLVYCLLHIVSGVPCNLEDLPAPVYEHLSSCFDIIKSSASRPKDGRGDASYLPSLESKLAGESLFDLIAQHTGELERAISAMSGYPTERGVQLLDFLTQRAVNSVMPNVRKFMGYDENSSHPSRKLLTDLAKRFQVPDANFMDICSQGVPLGIDNPIPTSSGIWPTRDPGFHYSYEPEDLLWADPMSKSALDSPDEMWKILDEEIEKGWIEVLDGPDKEAAARVKLCLLQKPKPDGSVKFRLIQDFARNGLNRRSILPETIQLPSLRDVEIIVSNFFNKATSVGETVLLAELDIQSAFRLLEVLPSERKYLYLEYHDGKRSLFGRHKNLPFGLRVSPYLFSRFLGVVLHVFDVVLAITGTKLVAYVDDVLVLLKESVAVKAVAVILVLAALLGVPWSFPKLRPPGNSASFIGYELRVSRKGVELKCSKARMEQVANLLKTADSRKFVGIHDLESLVGKLVFLTANCKWLRKYLEPLYKHVAAARKHKFSKIHVKGVLELALRLWIRVLHLDSLLTRSISPSSENLKFIGGSDASINWVASWVVHMSSKRMVWTRVQSRELLSALSFAEEFEGKKNSSSIALLELLGVLLCVVLTKNPEASLWTVCDSRAATCAVFKRASSNNCFNKLLASMSTRKLEVVYIPGWFTGIFCLVVYFQARLTSWLISCRGSQWRIKWFQVTSH